jgi:hypothetical protein
VECKQSNITDKLVPFVEGALAEPDRKEVQDHLPGCDSCSAEVKLLREMIQQLRSATNAGLIYRPGVSLPAEDLVEYALFGEQMSPETRRRIQLSVLESTQLQSELTLLNELESTLAKKGEPEKTPTVMPAALKAAVAKTYGTGEKVAVSPWRTRLTRIQSSVSRLNPRRIGLVAAMVLIVCLGLATGPRIFRALHPPSTELSVQPVRTPAARLVAVNSVARPVKKIEPVRPSVAPAVSHSGTRLFAQAEHNQKSATPAPAAILARTSGNEQVPVYNHKVNPEDLPRLSRQLSDAKISYSYRDGQLFVPSADAQRAWSTLKRDEQQMVASKQRATATVASSWRPRTMVQAPGRVHYAPAHPTYRHPHHRYTSAPRGYVAPPAREIASAVASGYSGPDRRVAPRSATVHPVKAFHPTHRAHLALLASPHRARRDQAPSRSIKINNSYVAVAALPRPSPAPVSRKQGLRARQHAKNVKDRRAFKRLVASAKTSNAQAEDRQIAAVFASSKPRKRAMARIRKHKDDSPPIPTEVNPPQVDEVAVNPVLATQKTQPGSSASATGSLSQREDAIVTIGPETPEMHMLRQAKVILTRLMVQGQIEVKHRADGTLLITIRPVRKLSGDEVDRVRTALRKELSLKADDTIVIRQP